MRIGWHLLRAFASLAVGAYYASFRVQDAQRIPREGPVLFVVNHPNGLVDGGVVLRAVPRPVHIAARGWLLRVPAVGWVLRRLGLVPLEAPRRTPTEQGAAAVLEPFEQVFRQGGAVLFFPEGASRSRARLDALKSGAARLAVDAEAHADFALGLRVVPIGLQFEPASRFRGDVHVRVGEAFGVEDLRGLPHAQAIRAAQERILEGLRPLVLHLEDERLEPLVRGVATVFGDHQRATADTHAPRPPAEIVRIAGACLNHLLVADPEAVAVAETKYATYRRLAERAGLDADEHAPSGHPVRRAVVAGGLGLRLLLGLPFFLVGLLTSYLPYRATDALAHATAGREGRVSLPTLRILWGAACFGLFWGGLTWIVAHWSQSAGVTIAFFLLLVLCGYGARAYAQRFRAWRARLRAVNPLRSSRIHRAVAARADLLEYVDELVGRCGEVTGPTLLPPRPRRWTARVPWRAAALALLVGTVAWFAWGFRQDDIPELAGAESPWAALPPTQAAAMLESDAAALESALDALARLEGRMRELKREFDAEDRDYVDEADARDIRQALLSYLNCRATLFRMVWFYRHPDRAGEPRESERAFLLSYVSGLELCRRGMQLIEVFRGQTRAIRKLNEGDVAFGLPPDTYDRVRANLASEALFDELASATARYTGMNEAQVTTGDAPWKALWDHADRQRAVVGHLASAQQRYRWDGAVARAERSLDRGRYELSRFVAVLIGEVRLRSGELAHGLISQAQVDWLRSTQLRPGDILLERRNWALSNVFLPGFWTHAALFVGGVDGLEELGILDDEGVRPHLAALASTDGAGNPKVVLEALGAGVVLNTLEYSVGEADAVCVLRPRMPRAELAACVARAIRHHGKPYDFDFDFFSADRLVCTELVYKAFQGPIRFELQEIMGRKTLPALEILRKWARERGTADAQLDLVCFLDSVEEEGVARPADEEVLLETLERPGLTVLQEHGGSARGPRTLLVVLAALFVLGFLAFRRRP